MEGRRGASEGCRHLQPYVTVDDSEQLGANMKRDAKKVTIEKGSGRVLMSIDGVNLTMSGPFAKELGDQLFRAGCDVDAQTQAKKK